MTRLRVRGTVHYVRAHNALPNSEPAVVIVRPSSLPFDVGAALLAGEHESNRDCLRRNGIDTQRDRVVLSLTLTETHMENHEH